MIKCTIWIYNTYNEIDIIKQDNIKDIESIFKEYDVNISTMVLGNEYNIYVYASNTIHNVATAMKCILNKYLII